MERPSNKKLKLDGTIKKSGGSRPGSGRKDGPLQGIKKENFTFTIPTRLKEEMDLKKPVIRSQGLDFAKIFVKHMFNELKKIPYPAGVEPLPEFKLPKATKKKPGKVGRPPKKK